MLTVHVLLWPCEDWTLVPGYAHAANVNAAGTHQRQPMGWVYLGPPPPGSRVVSQAEWVRLRVEAELLSEVANPWLEV